MAKRKRKTKQRQRRSKIQALLRKDVSGAFVDVPVLSEMIAALARHYPDVDVLQAPALISGRESAHRQGGKQSSTYLDAYGNEHPVTRSTVVEVRRRVDDAVAAHVARHHERPTMTPLHAQVGKLYGRSEKWVRSLLRRLRKTK